MGCVALPKSTTVSPLSTDWTLAKPVLGKMVGLKEEEEEEVVVVVVVAIFEE